MKTTLNTIVALIALAGFAVPTATAADRTAHWTGGASPNNNWDAALNWDTSPTVPNNSTGDSWTVFFAPAGNEVNVWFDSDRTISNLVAQAGTGHEIRLDAWNWSMLTVTGTLTCQGDLSMDDLRLTGNVVKAPARLCSLPTVTKTSAPAD